MRRTARDIGTCRRIGQTSYEAENTIGARAARKTPLKFLTLSVPFRETVGLYQGNGVLLLVELSLLGPPPATTVGALASRPLWRPLRSPFTLRRVRPRWPVLVAVGGAAGAVARARRAGPRVVGSFLAVAGRPGGGPGRRTSRGGKKWVQTFAPR